ncbi:hypothetical protein BDR26DRAFT_850284 [Obelidium mucronatum]|nr:hypothetical protein BDR26DRAFT_850284 [Obelidium mucronatum]
MEEAITFKTPVIAQASVSRKPETVHILPCEVAHSGHANTSGLFVVRTDASTVTNDTKSSVYSSNFRGRGLKGVKAVLGGNYAGLILQEGVPLNEYGVSTRYWRTDGVFSEMFVWGHDDAPTPAHDAALRAFAWMDVEADLHS